MLGFAVDVTVVVLVPLTTVCWIVLLVLPLKLVVALVKVAKTLCGEPPTVSVEVEVVATPPTKLIAAPAVPSMVNTTEPVGVPDPGLLAETVAVNVTDWPCALGFCDDARVVEVLAGLTF